MDDNKKEARFTVYEYNEKASPRYQGCRYMIMYQGKPETLPEDSNHFIVAENVSEARAQLLCAMEEGDSAETFLSTFPDELRTEKSDNFIKGMFNNEKLKQMVNGLSEINDEIEKAIKENEDN